jgi:hypothetical protein
VLLRQLEGEHQMASSPLASVASAGQFALFDPVAPAAPLEPHPVIEQLRSLDPNTITPLQALEILAHLVADAQQ